LEGKRITENDLNKWLKGCCDAIVWEMQQAMIELHGLTEVVLKRWKSLVE